MTTTQKIQDAVSGDNTTTHVATATTLGAALAAVASWGLQLAHVPPPPEVTAAFTVLFGVAASILMQKFTAS